MYIVGDMMISYAAKRLKQLNSCSSSQNTLKSKAKDVLSKDNKEVIIDSMKPTSTKEEKKLESKEEFIKRKEGEIIG